MPITFRTIEARDNEQLAKIIRTSLEEFKVSKIGTVYSDPTTDNLYKLFQTERSIYFIAEEDGQLLGGSGIYPTEGLPEGCAELVKFYLSGNARGKGIGKQLLEKCFESAEELGYSELYLETFPELAQAVGMYEKAGFKALDAALGNSGHFACNIWMLKTLD
ncbi:GNAT family N-acetyltransferase [Pedobacter sp. KBW06]|uniref:GNAT family N-acetyltransferase n=1 Tax=Pedobacter sp. KBW06 TaxID=2153359 RepID=UPI000F5ACB84|nr:GNAT family N-acetyltransferase [Pedobacter sp. KBW06]RQO74048.1 GNAT family N-acetyltransferase [Pedobacter sp. KBW06]